MDSFHLPLHLSIYKSLFLADVSIKTDKILSDIHPDGPRTNSPVSSDRKTNKKTFASSATVKPQGKSTASFAIVMKPNGKTPVSSGCHAASKHQSKKSQHNDFVGPSFKSNTA